MIMPLIFNSFRCFLLLIIMVAPASAGVDDETIFNWAESTYPTFFSPSGVQTQEASGYLYRFYQNSNTYAGTKAGEVYVLGDLFGGLVSVGTVDDLLQLAGTGGPTGSETFTLITALTVNNDQALNRQGEVAYSGIPLAKSLQQLSTDNLAILNQANQRVPAQFEVLSRWGGTVSDATLPIRWLEVAFPVDISASAEQSFSLGTDTSPLSDTSAATIEASGGRYIVNTGAASFTLNPNHHALFEAISIGGSTLNVDTTTAGPTLLLNNGVTTQAQLDSNSFQVLQDGPVRVVVAIEGHFVGSGTTCQVASGNYESQGFMLVASFSRAQSYVDLQFHYRNECSSAESAPWTDESIVVDKLSYELPLSNVGTTTRFYGASTAVTSTGAANVRVSQQQGSGTPWSRQAKVQLDDADSLTATEFEAPFVGLSNSRLSVAGQLGWMRYREPQALHVTADSLSIEFISQTLTVGEARGIWNFARLHFTDTTDNAGLEKKRAQGAAALERGLLPRSGQNYVNSTAVFPSLGNQAASRVKTDYLAMMEMLHSDTVNRQWSDHRTYGSQLWPESQFNAP